MPVRDTQRETLSGVLMTRTPYGALPLDIYGTILFFVSVLGGLTLIVASQLWAAGHSRTKGTPLRRERKAWIALIGVGAVLIVGAALTNDHPIKETIDKIGDGRGMREAMVQPIALNRLASMRSFGSVP